MTLLYYSSSHNFRFRLAFSLKCEFDAFSIKLLNAQKHPTHKAFLNLFFLDPVISCPFISCGSLDILSHTRSLHMIYAFDMDGE